MSQTAPSPISDKTLDRFESYLAACGAWLKKNFVSALLAALISYAAGWIINVCLMGFVYDGFRMVLGGGPDEALATGENNVRNGMLMWSLFSSTVFGLAFYWRAVGTEKFCADISGFPEAVTDLFRRDGKSVWIHICWGAAVSLLATYFISRWVGLALASVILATALSPLGIILASMAAQVWRSAMRDFGPAKGIRPTGLPGVMVGTFTTALILAASFFFFNPMLKIVLGVVAGAGAIMLTSERAKSLAPLIILLIPVGFALFLPGVAWADDGGFAESGSDYDAWVNGPGFDTVKDYAHYGGVAAAVGATIGAMVGGVNGSLPEPPGGWMNSLDPANDDDPEGGETGGGDPGEEPPTDGEPGDEPSEAGEGDAGESGSEPAEEDSEPVPAAASAAEDEDTAATDDSDVEHPQDPDMAFDPDNASEVIAAANAGNPEAIERLKEMKGQKDPSLLEELAERAGRAALGPVGSALFDEIGGLETIKELIKTDWGAEVADTASALGHAAYEYGSDFVEGVSDLAGFLWDKGKETVEGAAELATMDSDEFVGMVGQIKDDIANSVVGQTVAETLDGIKDLATMDRSEWLGLADQIYRDGAAASQDAVDALADRIIAGEAVIEGMTAEQALHQLGTAMGEAERYVDRAKKDFWRQDPEKVREVLAEGTVAVAGEIVSEVTGEAAVKWGGKALGMLTHADEAVDAVRAAERVDDAVDAARAEGAIARHADDAAEAAGSAEGAVARHADDAAEAAETAGAGGARRSGDAAEEAVEDAAGTPGGRGAPEHAPDGPAEVPASPDAPAPPDTPTSPGEAPDVPDRAPPRAEPTDAPPVDRDAPTERMGALEESDPEFDDIYGKPPEPPPAREPVPERPFDPERTEDLGRPDLPPEPNDIAESMETIRDHDMGEVPGTRRPDADPDMEDWRGRAPEPPPPREPVPERPFDPERTEDLGRPDLPPEPNDIAESMETIRDHDMGEVPGSRRPDADPDMEDWRGRAPEPPPAREPVPERPFDPERTEDLGRPDLPPEPNRIDESLETIHDHDMGDVPGTRRPDDFDPDGPTHEMERPVDRDAPTERFDEPVDRDAPTERFDEPVDRDAPTERFDEPDTGPKKKFEYGDDYDGPAAEELPTSRDATPGTMEEGWEDRRTKPFGDYDDDPLIDPRTGEPMPDPTPKPPADWDPEGSMPSVTDDGVPSLPAGEHNPLDEAYARMRGAERQLDDVARAADPEDAARRAHEQYEHARTQAEEALNNPAMRERMDPDVVSELEDSVRPENRQTLDDFRRRAGLDEAPDAHHTPHGPDGDGFDPDGVTHEMDRPPRDDFDPDGVTREMDRPDDFDPDGVTREMDRPGNAEFDPEKVHTFDRSDVPPRRPAEGAADLPAETLPPPKGAASDGPSTARFDEPDLPPDGPAHDGPRTERFDEPDLPPEGPPPPDGPDGPSATPPDDGGTMKFDEPDLPPNRAARDAPVTPGPDHPMMADEVRAMPPLEGESLANREITARTVTGHDANGLPIPHPHDEVTIEIGEKLSNGSFNDVYYNKQSYFSEELGEGAKDTLVRVSKPLPDPPNPARYADPDDFARADFKYRAEMQALRGDQLGREALADVAAASDAVDAPKVLGRFEVLDEVRDASGAVVGRSRRVAEVIENVTDGGKGTRALDVLRNRPMNVEEAIAYDKAVRAFNDKGYILTDTHAGNFTFIDMPDGTKKVSVFDPGGIFPVHGNDAAIARQLQSQIQSPGEAVMKIRKDFAGPVISDEIRPSLIDNIDGERLGLDIENFAFKPDIGRHNPRLGELFGADDAEAAYKAMREAGD